MEIYERNVNSSVQKLDDVRIGTKATLLDLNHNMRVDIIVNTETRVIERARVQIVKAPFGICQETGHLIDGIRGLTIERGVARKLHQVLGRSHGCTHIYELALEAVRLSSMIMLGISVDRDEWINRKLNDEDFIEQAMPFLRNTCLPFSGQQASPAGGSTKDREREEED